MEIPGQDVVSLACICNWLGAILRRIESQDLWSSRAPGKRKEKSDCAKRKYGDNTLKTVKAEMERPRLDRQVPIAASIMNVVDFRI